MSYRAASGMSSSTVSAIEYGSSPVEQPADQSRTRPPRWARSISGGSTRVLRLSKWCGSRKKRVTLVVIAVISSWRSCSAASSPASIKAQ